MTNMVAENNPYATETADLRGRAAECRLTVIESELSLAFTVCALAETQIRYGELDEAAKLLHNPRHRAESIRIRLEERDHL